MLSYSKIFDEAIMLPNFFRRGVRDAKNLSISKSSDVVISEIDRSMCLVDFDKVISSLKSDRSFLSLLLENCEAFVKGAVSKLFNLCRMVSLKIVKKNCIHTWIELRCELKKA